MSFFARLSTVYGGATLGMQLRDGFETSRTANRLFFPLTALQCAVSRLITSRFDQFAQTSSYYQSFKGFVQRTVTKYYTQCEKPLTLVNKTAEVLSVVPKKTIPYDPTPYSESLSFILNDIAVASKDLKVVLSLTPNFLQNIDKVELIARQEIIDFLKAKCGEKILAQDAPLPPPPPAQPVEQNSRWFSRAANKVSSAYNSFWAGTAYLQERVTAPIKRKAYETIPGAVETGVTKITGGLRTQVQQRRQEVESRAIPKATDAVIQKLFSFATFATVNYAMSKGVQWATKTAVQLVAVRAVQAYFPATSPEEIDTYSANTAYLLYNTYLTFCVVSYTLRLAAWKRQRIQAQATGQYLQDRIGDPVAVVRESKELKSAIDTITITFKQVIETAGEFLDIDISPAIQKFESRCALEFKGNNN